MDMQYYQHLLILAAVAVVAWCVVIYFWPRMLLSVYKRAVLVQGFGEGPIPVNTLYTQSPKTFAEPLAAQSGSSSNLMRTGVSRDLLYTMGVLDLRQGPLVLHVPEMNGRYYGVQFTDSSKNTVFAYVGKRATGTQAGDYLISGPGWKGQVPGGLKQIPSPNNSVILVGRVFVESDSDLATAYDLSKQIQLTPLSRWQPSQ